MSQSKVASMIEAWVNILIGFGISFACNLIILPWFGLAVSSKQAFQIGLIMTVVSLVRSYLLRRWFNAMTWGNR